MSAFIPSHALPSDSKNVNNFLLHFHIHPRPNKSEKHTKVVFLGLAMPFFMKSDLYHTATMTRQKNEQAKRSP